MINSIIKSTEFVIL